MTNIKCDKNCEVLPALIQDLQVPPDCISVRVSTFVNVVVMLDTTVDAGMTEVLVTRLVTGTSDVIVAARVVSNCAHKSKS